MPNLRKRNRAYYFEQTAPEGIKSGPFKTARCDQLQVVSYTEDIECFTVRWVGPNGGELACFSGTRENLKQAFRNAATVLEDLP